MWRSKKSRCTSRGAKSRNRRAPSPDRRHPAGSHQPRDAIPLVGLDGGHVVGMDASGGREPRLPGGEVGSGLAVGGPGANHRHAHHARRAGPRDHLRQVAAIPHRVEVAVTVEIFHGRGIRASPATKQLWPPSAADAAALRSPPAPARRGDFATCPWPHRRDPGPSRQRLRRRQWRRSLGHLHAARDSITLSSSDPMSTSWQPVNVIGYARAATAHRDPPAATPARSTMLRWSLTRSARASLISSSPG